MKNNQFEIGDIIIGTECNYYGAANYDAIMVVESGKLFSWYMGVRIIFHKDKRYIGKYFCVDNNAELFKLLIGGM